MAELPVELPYRAEYAKTGRAKCKGCQSLIDRDELKLAIMIQSRFHDGKDPAWYHASCFLLKIRPKSVGDIAHFEQLRYNDQEMLKKKIAVGSGAVAPTGREKLALKKSNLKDFSVAYAKSGQSKCQACEEKIPKGDLRIGKKDYESDIAVIHSNGNGVDQWHHVTCFVKIREHLGYFESGKLLPGYRDLDREDQDEVQKQLPAIKPPKVKVPPAATVTTATSSSSSKRKLNETPAAVGSSKRAKKENDPKENELKEQMNQFYRYRDSLKDYENTELRRILRHNKQETPATGTEMLDMISDIMTFGATQPCPKCKTGQFVFRSGIGYQCIGDLNEFTKCLNVTDDPERIPFKIPKDFREIQPFKSYKFKPQKRIIQKLAPSAYVASGAGKSKPKLVKLPLKNFCFLVSCTADKNKVEQWTKKIIECGGEVVSRGTTKVAALITTQDEMTSMKSSAAKYAEKKAIPVVKGDFVDSINELNYNLAAEMNKNLICNWITDVTPWLRSKNGDYEQTRTEGKMAKDKYEKKETSVRLKMKGGAVVDPDSQLEDVAHVMKDEQNAFYNCVLNATSIENNKNSYYKQQIIESDIGHRYWVFQSWGRIGTVIGGNKLHEDISKHEAIDIFCKKFFEKSGNKWGKPFTKKPGCYTMLELDYGEKEHLKLRPSATESTLPLPVQELVSLIFDVERMKQAMLEFELNLEEMPLGKISRNQILGAYSALSEASAAIDKAASGDEASTEIIRDVTNRFYTMIPHNFGARKPPMLDNDALVKTKLEMLESLLEIELAYDMLLEGDKGGESSIDSHYKTLAAAIDPLESGSEEYAMLEKYLKNTHADTHSTYSLDVEHIFKVNRDGERRRYRPFEQMDNRKLLWHGSRITNFAGILSQGLRIAPPEAPVTGYMFGKGVYFADMVSKSSNYCHPSRDNTSGLLLLCEVALGNMHELKRANDNLCKAPKNFQSVKGCGQTHPNPAESVTLPSGVEVPLGKPIPSSIKNSDLLYNEYIVYDTAQVNIRYLLKVNFNFGGRR
ncbi:poly [ADP-ribose] polymerase [Folsomia candida]|nr:poly [ADP-ribose] polymerase [Folsomia candida]